MEVKFFVDYLREDPALADWVDSITHYRSQGGSSEASPVLPADLFQEES